MSDSSGRENNLGILRILFASLVIASHSPEMIDGNRSRELLTMAFGTMSFGELAVDGFFLVSGYLITQSWRQRSIGWFLAARVTRIFPGFLIAFALCLFFVAPWVTTEPVFATGVTAHNLMRAATLGMPIVPGAFDGNHYPLLNGALWTIRWEFLCYLGTAALGLLGFLNERRRLWVLLAAAAMLILNGVLKKYALPDPMEFAVRFSGIYLTGATYYLYKDKVRYGVRHAALALAVLLVAMLVLPVAEGALAILGGYLCFWFAFSVRYLASREFEERFDLSYGLYLYAWPVGSLLVWLNPTINPWVLGLITLAISVVFGIASWRLVEKPAQDALKSFKARRLAF